MGIILYFTYKWMDFRLFHATFLVWLESHITQHCFLLCIVESVVDTIYLTENQFVCRSWQ